MSDRFQCEASLACLAETYDAALSGTPAVDSEVVAGSLTGGLMTDENDQRLLLPIQFGIAPPNSETPQHPTFDHCLASIEEPNKWPWLDAIETSRCIVPISAFHVCSYWGDPEGTEIYFQPKVEPLLQAAAICRRWHSPINHQHLQTMSLLTRPASDYVMDHGCDRQPIFLCRDGIDDWITPRTVTLDESISLLRQHCIDPQLTHRHHRDMPAAWRKHQKQMTRRRGQTMAAQDRCPHACGF